MLLSNVVFFLFFTKLVYFFFDGVGVYHGFDSLQNYYDALIDAKKIVDYQVGAYHYFFHFRSFWIQQFFLLMNHNKSLIIF